jgi:serine/threonine-protein kinase HipA
MRVARVFFKGVIAGILSESEAGYFFEYDEAYKGDSISLTMPITTRVYEFKTFPPFFDGLLPEGGQLEGLLRLKKLDRTDYFGQLISVGQDLVGAVTVEEVA